MKKISLLLGLIISALAFGQNKKPTVSGTVKDSATSALMYATVSLYKPGQLEQPVRTTFTNDRGNFKLHGVDSGVYDLVVSHTGFTDHQQSINISNTDLELNTISLFRANGNLKGVTVTSRKPLIEQTDDKIIFNVENDPATKTETAIDILRKTPFVSVDGDNNIQVNGQTNFKVLLNGRETAMFAQNVKEALKGFPGSLIVKIEVITSPSAKYDAEGVGGIINIITKKKVSGYNGSISSYASTTKFANINTNFSAKFGKLGITVYYGAGGTHKLPGKSRTETTPFTTTTYTHRLLTGARQMTNFWNFGNGELSYEFDSLNTVSAYGNISGGHNRSILDQAIITDYASEPSTTSYYDLDSKNEYPTKSVGTDYIRKFKNNKEREFSIRLNGEFGNSNTFLNSLQDNPSSDRYIINRSIARNRQFTIQSDYIHPLKNNQKIEGGLKAILRKASSDFQSQIKYSEADEYSLNPANTDYFEYLQNVYSVYASYSFKLKKTTFRLGTRLEHTTIDGDFVSSQTKVQQDYTTILPNIQATTKFNNSLSMVLGYNMRLQRPYIWNLNPFVNNNDSLFISYGNPQLDPQTIHSISTQLRVSKGGTFAGLTLSGSYSDNMIVQFASFNKTTGVTSTTSDNLGKEIQVSLNGNVTTKINPDWNVFVNGNVRYNRVENKRSSGQSNSGIGGNANLNTNYNFSKKFNTSAYAGFWRSPVTIQYTYPLNHWYGIGAGYKFFKEKLNVTLMASNFLKKNNDYRMTIIDPNFQTITTSTFPFRGIALSVTWNFGKMTENVSKKKGVTNDDLLGNGNQN